MTSRRSVINLAEHIPRYAELQEKMRQFEEKTDWIGRSMTVGFLGGLVFLWMLLWPN